MFTGSNNNDLQCSSMSHVFKGCERLKRCCFQKIITLLISFEAKFICIYRGVHIRINKPRFMKQMAYFWPSFVGNRNAIRPQLFRPHFSIDCSFKMRYCMSFHLNWHRNYVRLKLKARFLLSEFGSSKFDLS